MIYDSRRLTWKRGKFFSNFLMGRMRSQRPPTRPDFCPDALASKHTNPNFPSATETARSSCTHLVPFKGHFFKVRDQTSVVILFSQIFVNQEFDLTKYLSTIKTLVLWVFGFGYIV